MIVAAAMTALLLGGCAASTAGSSESVAAGGSSSTSASALLARHGLAGDAVTVVDRLEKLGGSERPRDLMASVRPTELELSDEDGTAALPIPADRFYLSVAPYAKSTHECYFHSLTTCQGELSKRPVHLKITGADGAVIVDEDTTTNANGFVGTWVPRGSSGTVEVTTSEGHGSRPFSTGDDDPTCMTTLKLS
ncbi:MAG TPA: CueP family metal-binding protein [Actinomycetales bacterium]|nr:CueP family metal-binding protein [Actinomycetales bacterium]